MTWEAQWMSRSTREPGIAMEPGSAAKPRWQNWANRLRGPLGASALQPLPPHYNTRPFPRSLLPLETDVASATTICHHNEVQIPQLPPLLGYACTTATGRVGLQYLTFWLLSLGGVLLPKMRDFPDIGRRFQCSVARKKDIGPLWWLSPYKYQTRSDKASGKK